MRRCVSTRIDEETFCNGDADFCDAKLRYCGEGCGHGEYDCDTDAECGPSLNCTGGWLSILETGCCSPDEKWSDHQCVSCVGEPDCGGGGTKTPTPTPTPEEELACAGDCDGDGRVVVNELITAVNIALGEAPVSECPACDTDHDGTASISELVSAVNAALNDCPAEPVGELVGHSACKGHVAFPASARQFPGGEDCLEWSYAGAVLSLTHVDATFGCCAEEFQADFTVAGGEIKILERVTGLPCPCLCSYDLDYAVSNLPPGSYTILIDGGHETLSTAITLTDGSSGTTCVGD